MSHNIAQINGQDAIAYVGESPWHRLGTSLQSATDLDAALVAASLNWDVESFSLWSLDHEPDANSNIYAGSVYTARGFQAITRTDATTNARITLGVVGPTYTPIQHCEAFALLKPSLESGLLTIEVAGALGSGETVWMLARLAGIEAQSVGTLANGRPDRVTPFVLITTSHDGSRALTIKPTRVRVVCKNTLEMSDGEQETRGYSIAHRKNANQMLSELGHKFDRAIGDYSRSMDEARQLESRRVNGDEIEAFMDTIFPLPPKPDPVAQVQTVDPITGQIILTSQTIAQVRAADALKSWEKTCENIDRRRAQAFALAVDGAGNTGQSLWDCVNGVAEYVDHTTMRKSVTESSKATSAQSALWGLGAEIKAKAWQLARRIAVAA